MSAAKTRKAINQRRYRRRSEKGVQIAPVTYDQNIVDFLVSQRLLTPSDMGDRLEVAAAIEKWMQEHAA